MMTIPFLHKNVTTVACAEAPMVVNDNDNNHSSVASAIFHNMSYLTKISTWERTLEIILSMAFLGVALVSGRLLQQIMNHENRPPAPTTTSSSTNVAGAASDGAGADGTSTSSSPSSLSGADGRGVVTILHVLILLTSVLRALLWFGIPEWIWRHHLSQSNKTSSDAVVYAFRAQYPGLGKFMSQVLVTAGSLALFSIFILILVYWADILKKYFRPGERRPRPMTAFVSWVLTLAGIEALNVIFVLLGLYPTEGMIL